MNQKIDSFAGKINHDFAIMSEHRKSVGRDSLVELPRTD
jgi:hypothetical protein